MFLLSPKFWTETRLTRPNWLEVPGVTWSLSVFGYLRNLVATSRVTPCSPTPLQMGLESLFKWTALAVWGAMGRWMSCRRGTLGGFAEILLWNNFNKFFYSTELEIIVKKNFFLHVFLPSSNAPNPPYNLSLTVSLSLLLSATTTPYTWGWYMNDLMAYCRFEIFFLVS